MSKDEFSFESYSKLKEASISLADLLKSKKDIIAIISQNHSDNLSASGIIVSCLKEHKIGSHVITVSDSKEIEGRVKNTSYSTFIFIGFEANELPIEILNNKDIETIIIGYDFIIDKEIKVSWEGMRILSLNKFGLENNLLSNSGIAYLVASGFLEDHYKYSGLAILGALARKQIDTKQKLIGISKLILEEGKEYKILRETKGIKIPGRESQPINQALEYSINPVFPGLTGKKDACTSFVSKLDIDIYDHGGNPRTISQLTSEETLKLNDALVSLLEGEISKILGPI
ncbi:hypothetical protein EU534_02400, partial [Candidatus Heimdallarchaeota archaeon]